MVTVGELQIKATIDDKDIVKGFNVIINKFDQLEGKTKGMTGDFVRLDGVAKGIGQSFLAIGASTLALVAFAKDSPALAGSMASISVSFERLKRAIGEGLQGPVGVFSGLLESLSEFAESDPGAFVALAIGTSALAGLFGLAIVPKAIALSKVLGAMKILTFSSGAIAGLTLLAGILTIQNWDDIKEGISTIGGLISNKPGVRENFGEGLRNLSPGGFLSDVAEGAKLFLSPFGEIFGANPYTPEGWREQGEYVRSGRGTDYIRTQQNISYSSRNIVLGQGDLAP